MFHLENTTMYLWHKEAVKFFIFFLAGCILCFFTLGPNLEVDFGIIDDHGIVSWISSSINTDAKRNIFSDINTRYRPAYWLFRYIETRLWGQNASLWYLTRIFIAAFCISLCSLMLLRYCKPTLAFVFSAFVFLRWYWQ